MDRKKIALASFFFILGAYLLWKGLGQNKNNSYAQNQNPSAELHNSIKQSSYQLTLSEEKETHEAILQQGLKFCPELQNLINEEDKIKSSRTFGHNIHFKKEGRIHRIRIFTEDIEEGSFDKLVYFIEDEDGFPEIKEIDKSKAINPKQEYILELLQGTETIFDSLDITYELASGKSFNASFENGKLNKVTAENTHCEI